MSLLLHFWIKCIWSDLKQSHFSSSSVNISYFLQWKINTYSFWLTEKIWDKINAKNNFYWSIIVYLESSEYMGKITRWALTVNGMMLLPLKICFVELWVKLIVVREAMWCTECAEVIYVSRNRLDVSDSVNYVMWKKITCDRILCGDPLILEKKLPAARTEVKSTKGLLWESSKETTTAEYHSFQLYESSHSRYVSGPLSSSG